MSETVDDAVAQADIHDEHYAPPGLTEPLHQDQVPTAEQGRYDGGKQNIGGQAQYRQAVVHRAHRKEQKILKS